MDKDIPDMYKWKYERLRTLPTMDDRVKPRCGSDGKRLRIGLPMVLKMYENLPFWQTFFTRLGFEIVLSPESNRELYSQGQYTIPSDTVCYPAKLAHGHMEKLLDMGVDAIFYPCLPYNFDEKKGDNHYNCPVVAYYPELLAANMGRLKETRFLNPYFGRHRPGDFAKKAAVYVGKEFDIPASEVKKAASEAYIAYAAYLKEIRQKGREIIRQARSNGWPIIVLSGRPYHIDPEINHGINGMIASFGLAVVTEDAVAFHSPKQPVNVLNQWTYHSRLYSAAEYVATQPDMQLVQLVSFGCGIDAITTDEVRSILETRDKLYTQLKIDEINNLGAVRIRIRSLMAAMEAKLEQAPETQILIG